MKPNCFPNYLYLYLYLYLNESYSDVWNFVFVLSLHHFKSLRWTSSHAANAPSEDRSASLVNVLLQPLPHSNFDNETQIDDNYNNGEYQSLIRLNLWSVIDGHGGGCEWKLIDIPITYICICLQFTLICGIFRLFFLCKSLRCRDLCIRGVITTHCCVCFQSSWMRNRESRSLLGQWTTPRCQCFGFRWFD